VPSKVAVKEHNLKDDWTIYRKKGNTMSIEPKLNASLSVVESGRFAFRQTLAGPESGLKEDLMTIPYAFPATTGPSCSVFVVE